MPLLKAPFALGRPCAGERAWWEIKCQAAVWHGTPRKNCSLAPIFCEVPSHPVAGCRRLSIAETLKICLSQTRLQGCEVGEVYVLGLSVLPGTVIYTSRLAAAPISLECRFHSVTPFGDTGAEFFAGGVVMFHIRDGLLQGGKIDTALLPPICRIGGPNYASLGSIVTKRGIRQTPKSIIKPEAA